MSGLLLKFPHVRQRRNRKRDAHVTSVNRLWLAPCPKALAFLFVMVLFLNCVAFLRRVVAQASPAPVSLPIEVAQDSVKFVNGDHISGTVKSISNGRLFFTLDLTGETLSFPIENVSELRFAGPPLWSSRPVDQWEGRQDVSTPQLSGSPLLWQPSLENQDVIYLRDGSYFSANVTAIEQNAVEVVTSSGHPIAIPKEHIAGAGFHHPNDIIFQSDFSSKAEMRLTPVLGSWDVEKGQLVQASPTSFCRAYVGIVQSGVVRYEWAMELQGNAIGGLCFFASNPQARFGEFSYMVIARGRQLYFNKVIGEARHQGQRKDIPQTETLVRFLVEYDSRNGETLICTDGKPLMRFRDLNPLRSGACVLLHTEGRAVFDDLRITHIVGGIEGTVSSPSLDSVVLSNGDRVSGHVISISDMVMLRSSYASKETSIPRQSVRSIAFACAEAGPRRGAATSPEITFWNGDRIFGELIACDDLIGIVEMSLIRELSVPRGNLRAIKFPRTDSHERDTDPTFGSLPLIDFEIKENGTDTGEEIAVEPR